MEDWVFEDDRDNDELFGVPILDPNGFSRSNRYPAEYFGPNSECARLLSSLSENERRTLPVTLNPMQQQLLPTALGTDVSIVLSAPTGAGKTCVLDMAILRILLLEPNTRIYYIAPSKALCRLQAQGFAKRFQSLGLSIDVVTGDEGSEEEESDEFQRTQSKAVTMMSMMYGGTGSRAKTPSIKMVVCTPEKLEAETRKCTDQKLASHVKVLLLVDEIHHIGERDRGATLELVLTRFLWAFRHTPNKVRFVSVSATIPNVKDVAQWLCGARYFEFHERPVPLNVHVHGYAKSPNRNEFLFEQDLDRHVPDVLRTYSIGKPALVFVSSRKAAKDLAVKLREAGFGRRQPSLASVTAQDDTLTECLRVGIGYHSAGLSTNDRVTVENLFRNGQLSVVCCTSTLAVGVDLPANLVIIKSTRAYRGPGLGFQDLERATLVQMIGRAGRPGYDTEGTAVIMTCQGEESKFQDLSLGLLAVSSHLDQDNLREGLNAEIVRNRLTSLRDCGLWWTMTFAFASTQVPWDDSHVNTLDQLGCTEVKRFPDGSVHLNPTAVGKIASTHHLRLKTVASFAAVCASSTEPTVEEDGSEPRKWDLAATARAICDEEEFKDLVPRRDQKKFLNSIAWTLGRFKSPKSARIITGADLAFQLLQARLGGIAITDNTLRVNCNYVFDRAPRLARALLKMVVESKSNMGAVCALLCKCLDAKCWENDEVAQLDGIGPKTREKLANLGINTLREVLAPSNASQVPPRSITHARQIVASRRTPLVSVSDGALVIRLSPPTAGAAASESSAAGSKSSSKSNTKTYGHMSDWWLACLENPANRVMGWSETLDRLIVPLEGAKSVMVLAIHRRSFGIDSQLIVDIDASSGQANIVSSSQSFWEGFHLVPNKPVKEPKKAVKAKAKPAKEPSQSIERFFPSNSSGSSAAMFHGTPTSTNPSTATTSSSGPNVRSAYMTPFMSSVSLPKVHGHPAAPFEEQKENSVRQSPYPRFTISSSSSHHPSGVNQRQSSMAMPRSSENVDSHNRFMSHEYKGASEPKNNQGRNAYVDDYLAAYDDRAKRPRPPVFFEDKDDTRVQASKSNLQSVGEAKAVTAQATTGMLPWQQLNAPWINPMHQSNNPYASAEPLSYGPSVHALNDQQANKKGKSNSSSVAPAKFEDIFFL